MVDDTVSSNLNLQVSAETRENDIGIREIFASPFSYEFLLLLYVYSGLYKEIPLISESIPVDPTLFLMVWVAVLTAIIVSTRHTIIGLAQARSLMFLGALIAYSCLSLFWTPSIDYAQEKIIYLLFISMLAFLAAVVIATDPRRLRRFLVANIFLSLVILLGLLVFIVSNEYVRTAVMSGQRFHIFGLRGAYQELSRLFAFGIVSFVIGFWYFKAKWLAWIVLVPVVLIQVYVIFQSGGRGGLLGLLVAALILGSFSMIKIISNGFHLSMPRLALVIILGTACAWYLAYVSVTGNVPTTLVRLFASESLPNTYTYGFRAHLLLLVPEMWNESPFFGSGLGSYPVLFGHPDIRAHPHNVIAEVLIELGFAGFILYGSFLIWAIRSWWLERDSLPTYLWLFSITTIAFGFAMASVGSDLASNRFIWMTYGLVFIKGNMVASKESL